MIHLVHKMVSAYTAWLNHHADRAVERLQGPALILRFDRWQ